MPAFAPAKPSPLKQAPMAAPDEPQAPDTDPVKLIEITEDLPAPGKEASKQPPSKADVAGTAAKAPMAEIMGVPLDLVKARTAHRRPTASRSTRTCRSPRARRVII